MSCPSLSVVVVSYNMGRELPRTLRTLSPAMQRNIDASEYEVIVVDNGSTQPLDEAECRRWLPDLVLLRRERVDISPSAAVNMGIAASRSTDLICVMVDGARMASPGLLANAVRARHLHHRPVISTLAFHLGPKTQMQSILEGYDQHVEDELLRMSGWEQDGYRLAAISAFAGSSAGGWFLPLAESNALFATREMWGELEGFDEGFASLGGGLVNLDAYKRACELPNSQLIMLLGEGTFHQVHGGVATNSKVSRWDEWEEEYVRLRGEKLSSPTNEAWMFGAPSDPMLPWIRRSAQTAMERKAVAETLLHSGRNGSAY